MVMENADIEDESKYHFKLEIVGVIIILVVLLILILVNVFKLLFKFIKKENLLSDIVCTCICFFIAV